MAHALIVEEKQGGKEIYYISRTSQFLKWVILIVSNVWKAASYID